MVVGHKINFIRKPENGKIPSTKITRNLQKCIEESLENRLIEEGHEVGIISHLFLKQQLFLTNTSKWLLLMM